MPFFKSLPQNTRPPQVFAAYPELYRLWSEMSNPPVKAAGQAAAGMSVVG